MSDFSHEPASMSDQAALLSLAFDPRLADVWLAVFGSGEVSLETNEALGWFLRMAYLRGYEDALTEDRPGKLFSELGAKPPRRFSRGASPTRGGSK